MEKLTMADVKRNNHKAGRYYFSPDTMRFFNSKVESKLFKNKYFITSEKFKEDYPRLFTIREYNPKTHIISTVGTFQEFTTLDEAIEAIEEL